MKWPKFSFSIFPFVKKPYMIFFNITERCNLRCPYCFGRYYSRKKELPFQQIYEIFREFYSLGARRLGLSGGEPLLHRDIDRVIKAAVDLGYSVGINSNGILVPQHLKALKLVDNLSISLDGATLSSHEQYRGKGTFDKVIKGIEAAAGLKIPLHLCCTLTDANLKEWRKLLLLGRKYKASVLLSPLYDQFAAEGKDKFKNLAKKREMKEVLNSLIKLKKKRGNDIFFSEKTYELILNWQKESDISTKREAGHPQCLAGKKMVTIDSRGNLFPCVRVSRLVEGKNCLKLGVEKAYESISSPPCKSCRWACYIEYNSLASLEPTALLNLLHNFN